VRASYEVIAESYADARRDPWPEVVSFIESLPARGLVLDVGCGHGRHLGVLAARGHTATGLDVSRRLVSIGRTRAASSPWGPRASWIVGDATSLPFPASAFDACLAIAILHHLPARAERLAAVREIRRVLRPGGMACVSVWDLDGPRFRSIRVRPGAPDAEGRGDVEVPWPLPDGRSVPRFYHLFSDGELEGLIIEAGLHGETFFKASGNRYALARRHG
jgi:SAM-dependent methyltransferase